jgi:serine/threonine protein kinase
VERPGAAKVVASGRFVLHGPTAVKRLPAPIARLLERDEEGRRIGPFVLVRPIGRGGFAPVWLARERYGDTDVRVAAVKLFSLEGAAAGGAKERIVEEARALCRVEHPNVVRFYALPIDEGAQVVGLAMEHVAGEALDARIAAEGRLSVEATARTGAAIASALSAVHRAGLVHRDVKPANIVDAAGVPRLIDFGIAAAEGASGEAAPGGGGAESGEVTAPVRGLASGTRGYIDPCCARDGAAASAQSDLYALGATLFECLTGHVPAAPRRGAPLDEAVLLGRAAAPDVRAERPDTPEELAALVAAMIAPERAARPASADVAAARLERILRGLATEPRPLPPEDVGPFRGLGQFEEGDRDLFFGRSREIAAALEGLRSRGLVALVGPSGSGKSSLARAGLLPAIAEGALSGWPERWDVAAVDPGRSPRRAIAAALAPFVPGAPSMRPDALATALAARAAREGRGLALLVDPLEALTLADADERAHATALLGILGARPEPGVRAIVAARRDLLDPLLGMDDLGQALARGLVLVEPLPAAALGEALDQALAAYGYAFEDAALREEVLVGIEATEGAMPLVEFALAELWKKRDASRRRLTREGLRAIGGVAGALERHAEATLAAVARRAAAEAVKAAVLALTTPEGTRSARSVEELCAIAGPKAPEIVDTFERARLVVAAPSGVTLAHEALLARWGRLRGWIAEARDDRRLAEEIERAAARRRAEPEAAPLWRGRRLSFGEELARRGAVPLSAEGSAFLRASRRAARRAQVGLALASAVIATSLLGWGLASVRAARAEEAAAQIALQKEQEARRLADEKREKVEALNRTIEELAEKVRESKTREEADAHMKALREALGGAPAPRGGAAPAAPANEPAASAPAVEAARPPAPFEPERDWSTAPAAAPREPGSGRSTAPAAAPFEPQKVW